MRSRLILLGALCPAFLWADARSDFMDAAGHQKAQRWAEAAQAYAKSAAAAPDYAPAWKQLASCRFYLNDLEGAEATAQRYLKLQPQDSAFAAWAGQLRQKLGLPPLSPEATPTPIANPEPLATATPADGLAIPVPSQDAEVAPQEVLLQAATSSSHSKFGLRLLGSWGVGLGHLVYGESVNSSTAASGQGYHGKPAGGLGGAAELLIALGPAWELSLGAYPTLWSETQTSSQTSNVTRSNESSVSATLLPLLVGLGRRVSVSDKLALIFSAHAGLLPSTSLNSELSTVQTHASGLDHTKIKARIDYPLAAAWALRAGMEAPLNKKLSFYLGLQVLGASLPATEGKADRVTRNESGLVLSQANGVLVPATALNVLSASALAGLALHF